MTEPPDFSAVADDAAAEFHRMGERYLDNMLTVALAMDQRGSALMGITGGAGMALLAIVGTLMAADSDWPASLMAGLGAASLDLFVAAVFFGWSVRPTDWALGGYEPSRAAKAAVSEPWMHKTIAAQTQLAIAFNRKANRRAARAVARGLWLAAAAPFVGIAVGAAAHFLAV